MTLDRFASLQELGNCSGSCFLKRKLPDIILRDCKIVEVVL